jgi:hypothetical protein
LYGGVENCFTKTRRQIYLSSPERFGFLLRKNKEANIPLLTREVRIFASQKQGGIYAG